MTRWARYARAMFLTDRVELTTGTGRRVIGSDNEIAFLLHVVPPSPTTEVISYETAEQHAPVPLYDELGVPDGRVLDLMSSWVSHLRTPPAELVVLGMNAAELAANAAATERVVQDLRRSGTDRE